MRLSIIIIALCGVLVASEETEYNEPSLCLQETNPFAYSHCIRKRDTECQNGGFCGTCNNNSCQTCNGNTCRTTCNGNGCNQCPTGNCCNGQNCNVCSGMNCCNSNNCNSCVNSCNSGCSTFACKSACVSTCQTITTNCFCNLEQNNCFQSCRNQCIGDHCYEGCFRNCKCDCGNSNVTTPPIIDREIVNRTIIVVDNKPNTTHSVNISTIINLKNFISNKNIITNPINITNIQYTNTEKSTIIEKPIKCCYVVHPVHCFDIAQPPYKRCIQKRHWECSEICISVVVHLVHLPGPTKIVRVPEVHERVVKVPQPYGVEVVKFIAQPVIITPPGPIIERPQFLPPKCHFINQYPWIQCGHYNVQGCGSCYVCGNQQYNPLVCSTQTNCPGLCRGGIIYDNRIGPQILRYAPIYNAHSPVQTGAAFQMPMNNQRNVQG